MGALWPNKYKIQGDRKPDFVGQVNVDGVLFELAAWNNQKLSAKAPELIVKLTKPYIAKTAMDPIKKAVAVPVSAMPQDIEDPFGWDIKDGDIPF
jgi:hypothetical protein